MGIVGEVAASHKTLLRDRNHKYECVQDFVKKEIEPYKYPRIIEFAKAEDLPRTATGKVQRRVLREREHAQGS